MFCKVCRQCPRKADKSGVLLLEQAITTSKTSTLTVKANRTWRAWRLKGLPITLHPLTLMVRCMNKEDYKHIERLNTTYHIVKNEQPFVSFEQRIDFLKKQNGVDMGSQYHMSV